MSGAIPSIKVKEAACCRSRENGKLGGNPPRCQMPKSPLVLIDIAGQLGDRIQKCKKQSLALIKAGGS